MVGWLVGIFFGGCFWLPAHALFYYIGLLPFLLLLLLLLVLCFAELGVHLFGVFFFVISFGADIFLLVSRLFSLEFSDLFVVVALELLVPLLLL